MKSRNLPLRAFTVALFCLFTVWVLCNRRNAIISYLESDTRLSAPADLDLDVIKQTSIIFSSSPLTAPYKDRFWEAGQRLRTAGRWLSDLDRLDERVSGRDGILHAVESVSLSLVPFLVGPSGTPLQDLRKSFKDGSRGIVIPVGGGSEIIRFAGHLITSLRVVLGCELPIQIAYAGEQDLPQRDRDIIAGLDAATDLSFLDVTSVFDDAELRLAEGHWAVKPFAALASSFEQVIVMDADTVFLQDPEVLYSQRAFKNHGAYLFHDRLLWQHLARDRHDWVKDQIREPSPALLESLFWTEEYAEECDSGVVVLDKSRPEVLMGLLHTSWQNTYQVREEVTYKLMYGDKESWWMGLELAGSGYAFERHYASILGWETPRDDVGDSDCICSFTIAHLDDEDGLLWFNGSLLKNKRADDREYELPEGWMTDGTWEKGVWREDMSCMTGAPANGLKETEIEALSLSIEAAEGVDRVMDRLSGH